MRAKKFVATALAVGYFFVANCRFACAMGMSDQAPVAVEHHNNDIGACHHQEESKDQFDGQKNHPAPCCMTHFDSASVLLPAVVALQDVSARIAVFPIAVSAIELALPRLKAFWGDRGPPLIVSQLLSSSSRGPRAPPFPTAVL